MTASTIATSLLSNQGHPMTTPRYSNVLMSIAIPCGIAALLTDANTSLALALLAIATMTGAAITNACGD